MTYTVPAVQLHGVVVLSVFATIAALAIIGILLLAAKWQDHKHPDQASTPGPGTSPVPGPSTAPVDSSAAGPPSDAARAPAPAHGGLVRHTEIKVYADCRTEISDHVRAGRSLILRGHCHLCRPVPEWDADAEWQLYAPDGGQP